MKKIVSPAICKISGSTKRARAFASIEYENGKLSICGVVGPLSNGDCRGSAGQCYEEIAAGTPALGWTNEMLKKFVSIWERWHLNNMNPACEHQRKLGWREEAAQLVTVYHYQLTDEAYKKKKEAEKAALEALRNGETFTPGEEQAMFAALPVSAKSFGKELDSPYYKPKKILYTGDTGPIERQTRGWIRYDENPVGILCKPCPVCGYKYGTGWHKEEVPQEVIDWLFNLPNSIIEPAWV